MASGLFPPAGVAILRWDATPDYWGVLIVEAESAGALGAARNLWRAAVPGFFAITKTAPASPVQETVGRTAEPLQKLGAAQGPAHATATRRHRAAPGCEERRG